MSFLLRLEFSELTEQPVFQRLFDVGYAGFREMVAAPYKVTLCMTKGFPTYDALHGELQRLYADNAKHVLGLIAVRTFAVSMIDSSDIEDLRRNKEAPAEVTEVTPVSAAAAAYNKTSN